jgi:hypothetical protein
MNASPMNDIVSIEPEQTAISVNNVTYSYTDAFAYSVGFSVTPGIPSGVT